MRQTSYFKQKRSVTGANVCVRERYVKHISATVLRHRGSQLRWLAKNNVQNI